VKPRLQGSGRDWGPRLYVALITDLFQDGFTRCLVGTRGLLGEGWDATKLNVLIDLTAVTTRVTVNQVRGRALRLDPEDPGKLAHH
jgi:superfamily II DNA or RNA helicase